MILDLFRSTEHLQNYKTFLIQIEKKKKIFILTLPSDRGVDTSIKKFMYSLPEKFQIEYLSLRKSENFKKRNIKKTLIKSIQHLKVFLKFTKFFEKDQHENKIFFCTVFCKCLVNYFYKIIS